MGNRRRSRPSRWPGGTSPIGSPTSPECGSGSDARRSRDRSSPARGFRCPFPDCQVSTITETKAAQLANADSWMTAPPTSCLGRIIVANALLIGHDSRGEGPRRWRPAVSLPLEPAKVPSGFRERTLMRSWLSVGRFVGWRGRPPFCVAATIGKNPTAVPQMG